LASLDVVRLNRNTPRALYQRWSSFGHRPGEGDYLGVVRALLDAGAQLPRGLRPCGDAAIDALIEAIR
jgi:hypothetical protein